MRIEDDFFSVAITMPFEATVSHSNQSILWEGMLQTFNAQTRCSLRDGGQGMFNLYKFPTW